jgi:hypothetical protein
MPGALGFDFETWGSMISGLAVRTKPQAPRPLLHGLSSSFLGWDSV